MTKFILENLSIFLAGAGGVAGAILSTLWVVRYRIPQLAQQTEANTRRIDALEEAERRWRESVKKAEIYAVDGQALYMHRRDCGELRAACLRQQSEDMADIRHLLTSMAAKLEVMDKSRQDARTLQISFMAAVKQRMQLDFHVPEA